MNIYVGFPILVFYQRLEFLGDCILDLFMVRKIFLDFPLLTPGQLTTLRPMLVGNVPLHALFRKFLIGSLDTLQPSCPRTPGLRNATINWVAGLSVKQV